MSGVWRDRAPPPLCCHRPAAAWAGTGSARRAAVQDQSADQTSPGTRRIQGHPQGKGTWGPEVRETEPAFQVGTLGDDYLLLHAGEHVYTRRRNCPG